MTDQIIDTSGRRDEPTTGYDADPASPSDQQHVASSSTTPAVSAERIAQRAYDIYVERGGEHGRDTDDWFRAEAELINTPS
jgi:hypothetical protein